MQHAEEVYSAQHGQHCRCRARLTWMRLGCCTAASRNWRTALGRSDTGNSHQLSQPGVKGSALNVGTCVDPV